MRRLAIVLLLLASCRSELLVTLPEGATDGMSSVVLATEDDTGALTVRLRDVDEPFVLPVLDSLQRIQVHLYADDIRDRFEERGLLTNTAPAGRSIPSADRGYRWSIAGAPDEPSWVETMDLLGDLATFRAAARERCAGFELETLTFETAAPITDVHPCRSPCDVLIDAGGVAYEITRGSRLALSSSTAIDRPPGAGRRLYIYDPDLAPRMTGYEIGLTRESSAREWFEAPAGVRAVDATALEDVDTWRGHLLTGEGDVWRVDLLGWAHVETSADRTEQLGFIQEGQGGAVEWARGRHFVTLTSGRRNETTLPADAAVSSYRTTKIGGASVRAIGTEDGRVQLEMAPGEWTIIDDLGTTRPVVQVLGWDKGSVLVFTDDGMMHQRRASGEVCPAVRVFDGAVDVVRNTALGIYVFGGRRGRLVRYNAAL